MVNTVVLATPRAGGHWNFDEGVLLRLALIEIVPLQTKALLPAEHRQAVELGTIARDALPVPPLAGPSVVSPRRRILPISGGD